MIRFDSSISPEIQMSMCTPMNQILPPEPSSKSPSRKSGALFLGSLLAVNEHELLQENKITRIVSVLDAPWLPPFNDRGIESYHIKINDSDSVDMSPFLEDVCTHIDSSLKSGKNVLVHCQQGISRSAAVVIAYLIQSRGMTYDSAFGLLKECRPCVKPNVGFVRALKEWEGRWHHPVAGTKQMS
ncbi:phosphatases II [Cylindrobasidium torrendii FP15055 ss-10]|uniref:protein-tyrosine-phosphatase n=1 Tax=Cylindrobasidium torrendii FP15055 ss-10 TaxID=1314674 RepID=A0A0D7BHX7_9AGAR|nr:phosphatases II [Cylindrobasidium torrendii FP15055 ss-10]